jgi:pimeloyl-ACP methyl ester carboxylesterase
MATETWQHGFATTNGIRLHYVEQGEGLLMILLHGFPEFWYSWRYQIPVLAQHFHIVAPDMRGYNDSDKPQRVDQYHPSSLVEDVRGLIRWHEGESRECRELRTTHIVLRQPGGGFPQDSLALVIRSCARGHIVQRRSWYE